MGMKLDTREFQRTLSEYRKLSKRSEPEIVNTKGFFIARRAVVETFKADKGSIRKAFDRKTAKIVGMLINARRGKRGEKGLYGDKMAEAVAMVKAARLRAISFVKSGWLPAIKTLGALTKYRRGVARNEEGSGIGRVKQIGKPKGSAKPAVISFGIVRVIITNMALRSRKTTTNSGEEIATKGLQRAIDYETNSMKSYIEMKMREDARKAGIKTS
jgi:hypothetical protein